VPRTRADIKDLDDAYLTCRVRRHKFDEVPDDGGLGRKWQSSRTVTRLAARCERCATMRYEAWNAITGILLFADYRYPPGYALARRDGGRSEVNKSLRKEFLARRR
jgi:hypothetical protein